MPDWTAEIVSEIDNDFRLAIEINENEECRGRIERERSGELVVRIYPTATAFTVPLAWLTDVLVRAGKELP